MKIVESVLSLLSRKKCENEADEFANTLFSKMDIDKDGTITEEEFMIYCMDRGLFTPDNSKVRDWKRKTYNDIALRLIRKTV